MAAVENVICGADIYFWRQCLVLVADTFHSIAIGFILAFPSVLNPAILSPTSTDIRVTKDQASWISSMYGFVGIIGFCVMPGIMQKYGRKVIHILINLVIAIGFIMLALAEDIATLYAARSVQGLGVCGIYLTGIILAEYIHPKRRGYFISLKKSGVAFGSLLCHSLVLVCSWRTIAAIATISNVLAILLTFPWPESPAFLAMKGRYEECDRSYVYLHGDTPINRKELEDLITTQIERRKTKEREEKKQRLLKVCKNIVRRDFLKPFFIVTLLTMIVDSGGRYYNLAYIVQIIKEITGDNSVGIYCSISLDVLTMVACWASSYVITKFARRTMLFTFGYVSVALMFLVSFIVYLKSLNIATEAVWLTPSIILLNSFIFNLGVVPICFTVSSEVFPLEYKGSGSTATGIIFTLLFAITIKCTPIMMEETGIEGTYGIYGFCLVVCMLILHFILTETKDKTLQEIENEIKGIERDTTIVLQEKVALTTSNANTNKLPYGD